MATCLFKASVFQYCWQTFMTFLSISGSVVHVVCLQTGRLMFQSLVPPDQVSRCSWVSHAQEHSQMKTTYYLFMNWFLSLVKSHI